MRAQALPPQAHDPFRAAKMTSQAHSHRACNFCANAYLLAYTHAIFQDMDQTRRARRKKDKTLCEQKCSDSEIGLISAHEPL
ncbi:hypothetical protein KC19_8G002100 [Ceratodon purpureus]|uniref:Uncharacterized protein n=1 Tax=Ceratodon purpureus TaxID=3225 RepID=A0A8T0GVY0_CERPU|nr:hypothetical protein KC19_8G002100 [Ceratodon purpureus]